MPRKKTKAKGPKVEKAVEEAIETVEEAAEDLGEEIGKLTHYFAKIGVAVVELVKSLNVGDTIRIKGATTDFKQLVDSMQIEHKPVKKAKKGEAVGLKVKGKVRGNETVYKVEE